MRIDPALLLVVLVLAVPFIVELRTVAAWVGIDLSLLQTVLIGVAILGAIVVWAVTGDSGGNGPESAS
ncbi:hypothetical protein Halru_2997 [Halovivax ruber XH-70]|uniref:CbaC protein n=1 Tax=Halovivax ruber (strain DSM 18193 / JCM 13892 / XH-70) TaxID=797302 RepID=L0IFM3_HALRX|nr:hypothetical protein [Halovivax ruber]AGB17564.1 hypothetical protein Halru_2997 [Halovivax ruber XH-70]